MIGTSRAFGASARCMQRNQVSGFDPRSWKSKQGECMRNRFVKFVEFVEFVKFVKFVEFVEFVEFVGFVGFVGFARCLSFYTRLSTSDFRLATADLLSGAAGPPDSMEGPLCRREAGSSRAPMNLTMEDLRGLEDCRNVAGLNSGNWQITACNPLIRQSTI